MGWLRVHQRIAGAAALLALALQLVVSFAHVHVTPMQADYAATEILAAVTPVHDEDGPAGGPAPRGQSCDICATLAIGEGGQIAFPPSLVLPPTAAPILLSIADVVVVERRHSPAQSRAPPAA